MPNSFLVPETKVTEDGTGPVLNLGPAAGKMLLLTLGITDIVEQESLDVAVWGSADGADWGAQPLLAFPQKFYRGTYALLLDLSERPEVRHLQARWKVARWGVGSTTPLFGFYVFAEPFAEGQAA
jgi:hypothetical protein